MRGPYITVFLCLVCLTLLSFLAIVYRLDQSISGRDCADLYPTLASRVKTRKEPTEASTTHHSMINRDLNLVARRVEALEDSRDAASVAQKERLEILASSPPIPPPRPSQNTAIIKGRNLTLLSALCKNAPPNTVSIHGVRCCPQSEADKWLAAHPSQRPDPGKSDAFLDALQAVSDDLLEANIPFYIMGGTLLGWDRECGFISHTTDIDIGIMEEDWDTDKIDTALRRDFDSVGCASYEGFGWELTYATKKSYTVKTTDGKLFAVYEASGLPFGTGVINIKVDIRQMMREKDFVWMGAGQTRFGRHARWDWNFRIVPAVFKGVAVGVPDNVFKYLKTEYGPYDIVEVGFQWETGARNLKSGIPRWNDSFSASNYLTCTVENRGHADRHPQDNRQEEPAYAHDEVGLTNSLSSSVHQRQVESFFCFINLLFVLLQL